MKIDIAQLKFIDQRLRDILVWVENRTGYEFTITSLYRIGDSGVHGTLPLRGADLRCRHGLSGIEIVSLINANWEYDYERPQYGCADGHGKNLNYHLHIQVHPNTKRRKTE